MRWKWNDVYVPRGLQNIYTLSLCSPPLPLHLHTPAVACGRHTWRPWSTVLGNALGDWNLVNSEMHLESRIEPIWWCTWRLWDRVNWEMHFQTGIKQVWRCTWRPIDRVNSEMHLEAVIERDWRCIWMRRSSEPIIERVVRYTWRKWWNKIGEVLGGGWSGYSWYECSQSGGSQSGCSYCGGCESGSSRLGGMCNGSWESIHWLARNCGNVENWVQHGPLRDWLGAGDSQSWDNAVRSVCSRQHMQYSVYAVLGVCCIRCMLYLLYAVLSVCCTQCMIYLVYAALSVNTWFKAWRDRKGWLSFLFLGEGRVQDEKETDGAKHHEKLGLERISCASQFTIPDTPGTSSELACNYTDTRFS